MKKKKAIFEIREMQLTIREALAIEPLTRAKVLAGERGIENVVKSVNVMEVPDILDWVFPGELLVTTMYPLRDDAAQIQSLIPRLVEKGLAGLAVKLNRYIDEIPQCMLDDANRLDFPILVLPSDISFIDIIQPVTCQLLGIKSNEEVSSETIQRQFLDLVLNGGGFLEIAGALAQMLEHPVSIIDQFRKVLAQGFVLRLENPQKQFLEQDTRGAAYLSNRYQPQVVSQWPGREAKHMRVYGESGVVDLVQCPVEINSLILGEVIVWGTPELSMGSIDIIAVETSARITALKIMELRSIDEVEQRFQNGIFLGLLSDNRFMQEQAILKSLQLGYKLTPPYTVLVVGSDLQGNRSLSISEQNQVDESMYAAKRLIRSSNPGSIFWYQGPQLVVFYPLDKEEPGRAEASMVDELQRICRNIREKCSPYTVSIGISAVETELLEFRQANDCARQSLEIGQGLVASAGGAVTCYEDLGIFRTIALSTGRAGLERYCKDILGPLLEYDRQYGTELVETLRVFLENNQNTAKAAKALFIHYNTLRYRMECVQQILGDALEDPQKRLAIEIALQIYPLLNRTPS